MSGPWIAILAAAAAAAIGWLLRRRSIARRARCRQRFAAVLGERRPGLSVREDEAGRWLVESGRATSARVDGKALTRHAADTRRSERLFLAVADAADRGPRPLAGAFDLKIHGPRTLPRLVDEGLPLLDLGAAAARFEAADAAGVATIYVVDAETPGYVTDDHLSGAGIDARDLHGVALAVLRQRFDEKVIRSALAGGRAEALESRDGCGGSRLLLLPETLAGDERLFASAPSPALLLVAASRELLEEAVASRPDPRPPLPPAVFAITAGGLQKES